MHAATPRLHFQTLCQHEVFSISTMNAGSLCSRHGYYGNTINVFLYFRTKRHKIVEIFALLTTELSSFKMCKVGMLFCTLSGFNLMYITTRNAS